MKPLYKELQDLLTELNANVVALNEIDQQAETLVANCNLESLDKFIAFLDQNQKNVTGVVRVYIRDLTFMLNILRGSMQELRDNDLALFDLRMNDIKPVSLISADDCMNFPSLYQAR